MRTSICPDCGHAFKDLTPGKEKECGACGHVIPPRRNTTMALREALRNTEAAKCVCCGQRGSKDVKVEGVAFLLCGVCYEFSHSFVKNREDFTKYRMSGGAATWFMAGKRLLFDKATVGSVTDVRERDVPQIKELRHKEGTFQGGVPFGYKLDGRVQVPDEEQQLTLKLIHTFLTRRQSLASICRELTRHKRMNKHGVVSWNPGAVRFLARREGWM